MPKSLDATSLIPTSLRPGVRLLGGAIDRAEDLTAALHGLGYPVESTPWPPETREAINTAVVVWRAASSADKLQGWLEQLESVTFFQEATLTDFQPPDPALASLWGSLDDGVMGGVSTSQVQWQDGLRFVGQVSTANSGGFASVRTRNIEPPLNLGQWQGTVLYVRGDGQRYKWILRDNPGWDSLAYCRSFDTAADRLTRVSTPFLDMVATRRARTVPEASPLNPVQLYSMQLMLSKFEYDGELNPAFRAGSFELTVPRLGVYRQGPKPLVVLPGEDAAIAASLAAAGLTGVIPQGQGFEVIGASSSLPPEIKPAAIEAIFQAGN